ncbi:FRG domain-containing protein [Pseudoxanthobacter soli DSM 19599]|uniref:FRG domain-containing protein n=1 Tax=Pseudoxanthobacter soli DSM 19599 TaxID=1123029 RepID=A0A1M7ZPG8_9HYPH|nr:FRG domain-containing protein [Pseudoxanthobacter soli]SHO66566.1 FRG domain-containing protein [Pseudoxanthobacter soli DSM 19599]
MFSLIMRGNVDEWDAVPLKTSATHRFPIARFLEYTNDDIRAQFTPISPTVLTALTGIPAVFMSELQSPRGQILDYVNIRVGFILDVTFDERDLVYTFRFERNFGNQPISDRKFFERAFGMEGFELHRTHWAIKPTNIADALRTLGLISHGEAVLPPGLPTIPTVPTQEETDKIVIDDLKDYIAEVMMLHDASDDEFFYRGHSDKNYLLEPTLFRKAANGAYKYRPNEDVMVRELLAAQPSIFASDGYMLDKLVRMQHFGLPTRLLDLTSNPLVGLYFCVSTPKFDGFGNEIDGEVLVISTAKSNVMPFDSDKVSCIANISLLTDQEKNRMDTSLERLAFNETADCKKLVHFIKREKPYFENRIEPADLERILFVRARLGHERIVSQSGAFLMFGKDSILPETGQSGLKINRFTIRSKPKLLRQLESLNIKASTIYPGLDRAAQDIAKKFEIA